MTLSADADIDAETDLYGKSVTDLQSDIVIGDDAITGTLAYVTDYTDFSEDTDLQKGNFLALHFGAPEGYEITVSLGDDPIEVDSDGIVVMRIADKDTDIITATATKGEDTQTLTFDLSGLTCETEGG